MFKPVFDDRMSKKYKVVRTGKAVNGTKIMVIRGGTKLQPHPLEVSVGEVQDVGVKRRRHIGGYKHTHQS